MKIRFSRLVSPLLVTLLSVGAVVAAAPAASATHQGSFTARELLQKCNDRKTDKCAFRPKGLTTYTGSYKFVGSAQNCGTGKDVRVVRFESSSTTTNSFGIEMSAKHKVGESFEYAVTVSYRRDWSWTDTTVDEYRAEILPKQKKNIYVAKVKSRVRGDWEINFGSRQKGHYIWYVNEGQVDGQMKGSGWEFRADPVKNTC